MCKGDRLQCSMSKLVIQYQFSRIKKHVSHLILCSYMVEVQTQSWFLMPNTSSALSLLPPRLSPCLTLPLSSLSFLILAGSEESDPSPTQTINVCLPGQRRNCNFTAASYALCLQSVREGKAVMLAERKIEQRTN